MILKAAVYIATILSCNTLTTYVHAAEPSFESHVGDVSLNVERSAQDFSARRLGREEQTRLNHRFMIAVKNGDAGAVRQALKAGAQVDVPNQWTDDAPDGLSNAYMGYPALFIAIDRAQSEIVDILVNEYHADVNAFPTVTPLFETPLIHGIWFYCHIDIPFLIIGSDKLEEQVKRKNQRLNIISTLLQDPRTSLNEAGGYDLLAAGMPFQTALDFAEQCHDFGRLAGYIRMKTANTAKNSDFVSELKFRGLWRY